MRYLITGGAGFIGAHLAESLLANGHSVSVIDNLSTGSEDNLAAMKESSSFSFVKADILESKELNSMVKSSDAVFHLAAAVGVELVVHDPVRTIETNVYGTERILKAASAHSKRILVASTSEVYGKSPKEIFTETDDLLIGPSSNSRWSYACSKLLDEFFVMAYVRDRKLPGVVVRLFNTVGPRQTGRYGMVLPRFVSKALRNEPLRVYGSGDQSRCFCHVSDTIRALKSLISCEKAIGGVFNIGSTRPITIFQLAELVIKQLGSSSSIESVPYEKAYEKGFEDMLHRKPDISAVGKMIGWTPEKSLEQIIEDVASFIRSSGRD
ncbi:MAG: nucleoside-diphosphate sugar epimerase [Lentisphaerae bacterium GWF2_45_14]|nr:MAG: nucleoside-diphosphate sugar epimerase [Lentisphaerae bacterium GWF2_45_14]